MHRRTFLIGCATLVLSACQSIPHSDSVLRKGRFSLQIKDQTISTTSGRFELYKYNDASFLLKILSPLSTTIAQLEYSNHFARLTLDDNNIYSSNSAESLLWIHLGIDFPVSLLSQWLFNPDQKLPKQKDSWQVLETARLKDKTRLVVKKVATTNSPEMLLRLVL